MSRSTIKAIGLILLVPFVILGFFPVLASSTHLLDNVGEFSWIVGGVTVVEVGHNALGDTHASVNPIVWVVAGIGELMLLSVAFLKPVRQSRYVLTLR